MSPYETPSNTHTAISPDPSSLQQHHDFFTTQPVPQSVLTDAIDRGIAFFASIQEEDGSWCGDYGGPMFLLPMYVAATYVCKHPPSELQRAEMVRYFLSAQSTDGGVGIHAEADESMMFTTVLSYVALRLLDEAPEREEMARMRRWIRDHGGALAAASWAKWILCVLHLYEYDGLHPILPELYLLPPQAPLHPGHLWCHARQVYLPMAYLYGKRAKIPADPRIQALRSEIYTQPYESIRFAKHRDTLCPNDRSYTLSPFAHLANAAMHVFERLHSPTLRKRALEEVKRHIDHEDQSTNFIRIGPVNAVLNTLVHYFDNPQGSEHLRSWETLPTYLWQGHDGLKMNGYNSCKLWDTAFAVQAIQATPCAETSTAQTALQHAYSYIKHNQVLEDVPEKDRYFRHASRGGWPFSDRLHGWPITDCTSEGLKAAIALEAQACDPISEDLLRDSIRLILSFQNPDGGWASYERQRTGSWIERFNPSQAFRDIMVDYSYTECTSACLQALETAQQRFPGFLTGQIERAKQRGQQFLRTKQREDGSWEGSWAVCFTYGTWFGVWGLLATGVPADAPAIQKACAFLLAHQHQDGGWGEHYQSCLQRCYVDHPSSQAVQTAWALMTLCKAGHAQHPAAHRAARFLVQRQQADGDWPREAMVGVFNKTTLINYENYRRTFCLWALGLYAQTHA